ncbi:hypothetical protein ACFR99_18980 [Haloarchaeobius amylolyticus]|uniref:Uncharacterized protein n=1 Tax=Haloarchaeobius amylolyticus TaxID=1198296 RepID=A0ABD6BLC5_9EURY
MSGRCRNGHVWAIDGITRSITELGLLVFWFTVHYVFAALSALLEVKLEQLDRPSGSSD